MREISALPGRVIVRLEELPEKSAGGIYRPPSANYQGVGEGIQRIGKVVAAGMGPIAAKPSDCKSAYDCDWRCSAHDGTDGRLPMPVTVGDCVVFRSYMSELTLDGETLFALRVYPAAQSHILGVVEE